MKNKGIWGTIWLMVYGSVKEFLDGIKSDWQKGKRIVPILEIVIMGCLVVAFIIGVVTGIKSLLPEKATPASTQSGNTNAIAIGTNLAPIYQTFSNGQNTEQKVILPLADIFYAVLDGKYPTSLVRWGILSSTKSDDKYHTEINVLIGVAPGAIEPIMNSVVFKSLDAECAYDSIRRQPAVAVGGQFVGRIVYTYKIYCTSSIPINYSNELTLKDLVVTKSGE
jgi:hypothetical protein